MQTPMMPTRRRAAPPRALGGAAPAPAPAAPAAPQALAAPAAPALLFEKRPDAEYAETNDPFSQQAFCDLRVPVALRGGARCAYELDELVKWFTRRTLHHERLIDPVTHQAAGWDDIEAIAWPERDTRAEVQARVALAQAGLRGPAATLIRGYGAKNYEVASRIPRVVVYKVHVVIQKARGDIPHIVVVSLNDGAIRMGATLFLEPGETRFDTRAMFPGHPRLTAQAVLSVADNGGASLTFTHADAPQFRVVLHVPPEAEWRAPDADAL